MPKPVAVVVGASRGLGLAFTEAVGSVHAVARTEDCPGACAMAPALECSDLVMVEKLSTKYLHRHRRGDLLRHQVRQGARLLLLLQVVLSLGIATD